jgi:hypothetical protein
MMTNNAETIERLARELERQKIIFELSECNSVEDYKEFVQKLKAQCES